MEVIFFLFINKFLLIQKVLIRKNYKKFMKNLLIFGFRFFVNKNQIKFLPFQGLSINRSVSFFFFWHLQQIKFFSSLTSNTQVSRLYLSSIKRFSPSDPPKAVSAHIHFYLLSFGLNLLLANLTSFPLFVSIFLKIFFDFIESEIGFIPSMKIISYLCKKIRSFAKSCVPPASQKKIISISLIQKKTEEPSLKDEICSKN